MNRNVLRIVRQIVAEEYNKWFQSEENDIYNVLDMMREVKENLKSIESLSPQEVWETIRTLAYINHSAFKVKRGTWDLYPDEMLEPSDYRLNKLIYAFKTKALDVIIDYYLQNNLPISTNENSSIVILRDPITGHRQITFHLKKESDQAMGIGDKTGAWDGVAMAHRFDNDEDYDKARFKQ